MGEGIGCRLALQFAKVQAFALGIPEVFDCLLPIFCLFFKTILQACPGLHVQQLTISSQVNKSNSVAERGESKEVCIGCCHGAAQGKGGGRGVGGRGPERTSAACSKFVGSIKSHYVSSSSCHNCRSARGKGSG